MLDGVLNIYKEKGYTSHDVVAKMRGILRQRSGIQAPWTRMQREFFLSVWGREPGCAIC